MHNDPLTRARARVEYCAAELDRCAAYARPEIEHDALLLSRLERDLRLAAADLIHLEVQRHGHWPSRPSLVAIGTAVASRHRAEAIAATSLDLPTADRAGLLQACGGTDVS